MGKPRTALYHLEKALAMSERTHHPDLRSRTLLFNGDACRMAGDNQRAVGSLTEGLRIAREIHATPFEAQALIGLGELELKSGQLTSAETLFREGLDLVEQAGLAEGNLAARRGLAETCARRGDYQQAFRHLQVAVDAVESMRGRIPIPDLKSDFIQQNWKLYEDAIQVLARLHEVDPTHGYDRQAFYYAERGRARSFLDLLTESRANINKGLTSSQLQHQSSLVAALSTASAARSRQDSVQNRQAVEQAEREVAQWAAELRLTNPNYYDLQYPEPDDAGKVQSALAGTGTAVLEYALGERRSYVWIISEKQVKMARLPGRGQIEKEVETFRDVAAHLPKNRQSLDACQAVARRLYELLVSPIRRSLVGARQLLIVPDGILYYLPFEALMREGEDHQGQYLIEDFPIAYAPSASVFERLVAGHRYGESRHTQELLAYGDPIFSAGPAATGTTRLGDLVRGVYQSSGIKLPQLPNTRAEVESIAKLYEPDRRKIYLGASATESSVKRENLTRYKRLHFATHAVIDEQVPARSGIVLSLVDTDDEDGILRAGEIFNLQLDADLVVLSACQTGLGRLVKGEGMVGLTRAFLYAGTPRVLVSLWEVNDIATAEFMKLFYLRMKEGQSPALALREAKLETIRSGRASYQHPYFWTPFVLVGIF